MNLRQWGSLALSVLTLALLAACGGWGDASGPDGSTSGPDESSVSVLAPVEPEPDPEPVYPYTNPLTGEGLDEDISGKRPVAVMFNNLKKALPQIGVSQADVIYEMVAEGGITRMMGVFQDLEDVGELGTVRSAREYYVSLALGHDAIYIHAGGSPQAYDAFDAWGVTHIDFVNGPYGDMCWRDPERRQSAGLEHSLVTSSELILDQMPSRFRLEHQEGYQVGWTFDREPPEGGQPAAGLTIPFSIYKTGYFTYDPAENRYSMAQALDGYDPDLYVDAASEQAVTVSNVLVLYTDVSLIKGDAAGRMDVRTTGTGDGLLLRDGLLYEITWKRDSRTDNYSFLNASGQPIPLAVGPSYINVVSASTQVTWE